jgi:hypothetical protein
MRVQKVCWCEWFACGAENLQGAQTTHKITLVVTVERSQVDAVAQHGVDELVSAVVSSKENLCVADLVLLEDLPAQLCVHLRQLHRRVEREPPAGLNCAQRWGVVRFRVRAEAQEEEAISRVEKSNGGSGWCELVDGGGE